MKVLMVWVALNSAIDRPAVAKLLNLALAETKPVPLQATSSLSLTLLGTLVDRRGFCSAALVLDSARAHTVYRGELVAGATVVAIERDRVLLERDGQSFELRTHPLPLPSSSPEGGVHVSYAEIRQKLSELATQVRAVPVSADRFKLFAIAPDSLFAKVGLKNGDVVRVPVDAFQQFKPGNNVSVEIEREGRTFSLSGWID